MSEITLADIKISTDHGFCYMIGCPGNSVKGKIDRKLNEAYIVCGDCGSPFGTKEEIFYKNKYVERMRKGLI